MDNKITLPTGWNEISISQFQELSQLDELGELGGLTKVVEMIALLADKDPEEVRQYTNEDLEKILSTIEWTNKAPKQEYKTSIVIDDKEYFLVKLSSLTLGEWIDLETWCENTITNLHKIFALLYRPENEKYEASEMNVRAELFAEKMIIDDVYGTLLFFLAIAENYYLLIRDYTKSNQ